MAGIEEIGLMPDSFWCLTLSEFHLLLRGHRRRQEMQWEHTRFLGALMLSCVAGKDAPSPEQLVPLPIDAVRAKSRAAGPATAEEPIEAVKARILEREARKAAKLAAQQP